MVRDQIAIRGIKNHVVLKAIRETPRELFIPSGVRALAYPRGNLRHEERAGLLIGV
jgi:protein-L-isoaspartate O-methyltransferase